jgi:hypothetical protein
MPFRWRIAVPVRRLYLQKVAHEEIAEPPFSVSASCSMAIARHHEQVEIFIRFDKRMHYLHGRRWIDILVHLAHDKQQLALQPPGIVYVRRSSVLRSDRPAHPLLIPPDLVHAIVMRTAVGHGNLVEFRMKEQCTKRALPPLTNCRIYRPLKCRTTDTWLRLLYATGCGQESLHP